MIMNQLQKFVKVPILTSLEGLEQQMEINVRLRVDYIYSFEPAMPIEMQIKPENLIFTLIKMDDGSEYVSTMNIKDFEKKLASI